jgi:membrane protease YdiL (CAAX protease family)
MSDAPSDRRPWWEGDYVYRPTEDPEPIPTPRIERKEEQIRPPNLVPCRRCGMEWEEGARFCPFCGVSLARRASPPPRPAGPSAAPLLLVMGAYAVMLLTTVVYVVVVAFTAKDPTSPNIVGGLVVVELLLSFLVLLAVWAVRGIEPTPEVSPRRRLVVWLLGLPILALMLGFNFVCGEVFRRIFPGLPTELGIPVNALTVLLICVQPAVIEELFFRYLALGALRSHVGLHLAVFLSSLMFAAAHLGQFPFIPALLVIGIGLGYVRHFSGGLLLPMLIHFGHNLVVLLAQ